MQISLLPRLLSAVALTACAFSSLHAETFTLEEATIDQIQKAMADGALTSVELTSLYLNRIAIYDRSGIKLDAVPVIDPTVFTQAAAADSARAAGTNLGPLQGIPFTVKETMAVAGLPVTANIPDMKATLATKDGLVIKRAKAKGAILLGLNNHDFFYGYDDNVYGPAINPYIGGTMAAGSSGGTAIAVAANLIAVGIGEDNGGSLRSPAHFTSVVGFRESWGLTPDWGSYFSNAFTRDVWGPMARSVKDAAYVFDGIVGLDAESGNNSLISPSLVFPASPYAGALLPNALAGKRIGVVNESLKESTTAATDPSHLADMDPQVLAAFNEALAKLEAAGATVVRNLAQWDRPSDETVVLTGTYDGVKFNSSSAAAVWNFDQFFSKFTNATITGADFYSNYASPGPPTADFLRLAALPPTDVVGTDYVTNKLPAVQATYYAWMAANHLDAIVYPTALVPANTTSQGPRSFRTRMPNLACPAISVPAGFLPDGITPVLNLEFGAKAGDEKLLLDLAYAFEQATKARRTAPLTPPLPGETIEYSTATPPSGRPELAPPSLRVADGAKVTGEGRKAVLVLKGGAVDASGLASLKIYINGVKIAAKTAKKWKAVIPLVKLRSFIKGSATTVQVTVVAKDIYGNTSVTTKVVKLPKAA